ncbi:MAG: hypothetical protein FJ271_04460 [Planctomycetes bacterium]|nr:hypothetical protein [Planctomycetota bacterium]
MDALQGKIHGHTVELNRNPGLPDGQDAEVHLRVIPLKKNWGEGLQRCAGAMADEWTVEDDQILEQISQERKLDTRQDLAE